MIVRLAILVVVVLVEVAASRWGISDQTESAHQLFHPALDHDSVAVSVWCWLGRLTRDVSHDGTMLAILLGCTGLLWK